MTQSSGSGEARTHKLLISRTLLLIHCIPSNFVYHLTEVVDIKAHIKVSKLVCLKPFEDQKPQNGYLGNSEDPDEIPFSSGSALFAKTK